MCSVGTATVSGQSTVTVGGVLYVGEDGTGTLTIQDRASVTVNGVGTSIIGQSVGASGAVTVTGVGSSLTVAGDLGINPFGLASGALNVLDGAQVTIGGGFLNGDRLTVGAGSVVTAGTYVQSGTATTTIGLSGSSAGRLNVGGTAGLDGALVITGHNVGRTTYTLVHSAGLGGSTFSAVTYTEALRNPVLTYTAGDVLLTVDPYLLMSLVPANANTNQRNVAQAIDNALAGGATPSSGFESLFALPGDELLNALTQLSGEIGTAPIQTAFTASNQFMNVLFDNRGNAIGGGFTPLGYAPEKRLDPKAAEAYAAVTPRDRRQPAQDFSSRWGVWGAGYGGNATVKGDSGIGSSDTTSRVYGLAAGAEYRFTPDTVAGFALGGAGSNFSTDGGSGRADIFQAGAYVHHRFGAAYLSGGLAYGWQRFTTDRTVTVSGTDKLEASFNAQTFAARLEGGYRFATAWVGMTPYAALQSTSFFMPSYAEGATSGSNQFALSYASQTTTDLRTELGLRLDRSFVVDGGVLALNGRAAWAHDGNTDRAASATFQTLPGATFTVNGAKPSPDGALLSAGVQMKWLNGFSLAGTFEGEFSDTTASYAGRGILKYAW
jgi:T5SS/PEP-CTERM-associated repeat protein